MKNLLLGHGSLKYREQISSFIYIALYAETVTWHKVNICYYIAYILYKWLYILYYINNIVLVI